jgi:hypothetical protein
MNRKTSVSPYKRQLRAIKMVQVLKSAQDFELFGGTALAPSGRVLKNLKAKAVLGRCAIFNLATAVFWLISQIKEVLR